MENHSPGFGSAPTRYEAFVFLHSEDLLKSGITNNNVSRLITFYNIHTNAQNNASTRDDRTFTHFKTFLCNIVKRWKNCGRHKRIFLAKHREWLSEVLTTPTSRHTDKCKVKPRTPSPVLTRGRRAISFSDACIRTKKLKVNELSQHSPEELGLATHVAYGKAGKRDIASVIKTAIVATPRSLKRIKSSCKRPLIKKTSVYTVEEALALLIDLKLTKQQYIRLRIGAKKRGCNLYPPYYKVAKTKEMCCPDKNKISITESTVDIDLQSLLDHTSTRIVTLQEEVILQCIKERTDEPVLKLTYKWGTDGSSNHSLYKQTFENPKNSDSDIMQTSLVPLQLTMVSQNSTSGTVLWQNPRPSSTRYCRPIRFQFAKETTELLKEEFEHIQRQIQNLVLTKIKIGSMNVAVEHKLYKTMVDGKVCNSLTDNKSAQVCYICKVSPKNANKIDEVIKRPCITENFEFGLSPLHARIRFFECVIHVSYKLDIQKGRANKTLIEERKRKIQEIFRTETGLLVDVVKQGKGNTNDGNCARRFFSNVQKAAEITGVSEELILRFAVILDTICCGYKINSEKFRKYAMETAKLYENLYNWYPMPVTVHKILIHGADVMESMMCPIGQLSEDALEARHKEYRKYRENNTRKMSRITTNEDLIRVLLVSSDPIISSLRQLQKRKLSTLSRNVVNLLEIPEIN